MTYAIGVIGAWRLDGPRGEPVKVRMAVRRLVAFLAVRGRMQQRALVAGSLWPESTERRASANLRSTLWHARMECPGIVDGDASTVWLCEGVSSDLDDAMDVVRDVLLGHPVRRERLGMLHDDLLPGWGDDWLLPVRFLHRQLRLLAIERSTRDAAVTTASPG